MANIANYSLAKLKNQTMSNPHLTPPAAELLIATGCVHCPVVLQGLTELLKEGLLGELRITNIVVDPQRARQLGVRSVPWTRLGPFTLDGAYTPAELRRWAERAGSMDGMRDYLNEQLKDGNLDAMQALLHDQPQWLEALIPLLEDEDTDMKVRIGVDALLEELAQNTDLSPLVGELGRLSQHERQSLRSDASHYLALIGTTEVMPWLKARLEDNSDEVREIAKEALDELEKTTG